MTNPSAISTPPSWGFPPGPFDSAAPVASVEALGVSLPLSAELLCFANREPDLEVAELALF